MKMKKLLALMGIFLIIAAALRQRGNSALVLSLAADGICDVIKKVTLPRFPALGIVHKRRNAVIALLSWWQLRNQALAQVFVEKFESARPRQFRRLLVITRSRVIMEAVLFAIVHVHRVRFVVGLERRLISRDAGVDALVIAGVMEQQRRGNLGNILCARLATIERDSGIQISAQPDGQLIHNPATKTEPDRAEFAGGIGARLEPLGRRDEIFGHLLSVHRTKGGSALFIVAGVTAN